jgi:aspartyl-tRNA(Asn)/glutamyl-tRNA(Gln) amidotransferase subunit C
LLQFVEKKGSPTPGWPQECHFLVHVFDGGPAMKITREDVRRVAELAHLELSQEELDTYRSQLDAILTYIAKLEQLDVTTVEPMAQVLYATVDGGTPSPHPELRDDVLLPCDFGDPVLAQAPDAAKPFFRVPKVIER